MRQATPAKEYLALNRKLFVISVVLAVSFIFSDSSQAETVNTTADLQNNKTALAYIYSIPLLESMYQLGIEEDRKFGLHQDCKSKYLIRPVSTVVLKPIEFSEGKQHATKGVWLSRYQLGRCGDSKIYNTLFLANLNGEAPLPRSFHAGSTNASPVLIEDALRSAVPIAVVQSGLKDCKTALVFDMRVIEPSHDVVDGEKTFKGVWNELWTFSMCGQMIDVAMTFIPDATGGGTSFMASPAKPKSVTVKP